MIFRRTIDANAVGRIWRPLSFVLVSVFFLYGIAWVAYPSALSGLPYRLRPSEPQPPSSPVWDERAEAVKQAFIHAYHGYEKYAFGKDEIRPLSKNTVDNFNGWAVSALDSMDTMWIMGLDDEYKRARDLVKTIDFSKASGGDAPYFETVIRYLGGLTSIHALTKDDLYLKRADELAKKLEGAFASKSGLPYGRVNPTTGKHSQYDWSVLAEVGTLQLEYAYLGKLTGKTEHLNRTAQVMKVLRNADTHRVGGMLPTGWNLATGQPTDFHMSVGAAADSAHEYLLKLYLLMGKKDKHSLEMYLRATTYAIANLLYISPTRNLLYPTDTWANDDQSAGSPSHVLEHLSCFFPGLLALGAEMLPLDNLAKVGIDFKSLGNRTAGHSWKAYEQLSQYNLKDLHMWAAEGMAQTCYLTYADQPSGLGPDEVLFSDPSWTQDERPVLWMDVMDKWKASGGRGIVPGLDEKKPVVIEGPVNSWKGPKRDYSLRQTRYLLRPETVESLFILWKVTGDAKWRERGWDIFQSIEKQTKTEVGYASAQRVDMSPAQLADEMPSYFLAETLKYLYLLFHKDDIIPLDKWVFNTEAHPLPVLDFTADELKLFT